MAHNCQFRINEAFDACDLNNNGSLDVEVFKALLERGGSMRGGMRTTDVEARNLAFKFDRNRDKRINFEEFASELKPKLQF